MTRQDIRGETPIWPANTHMIEIQSFIHASNLAKSSLYRRKNTLTMSHPAPPQSRCSPCMYASNSKIDLFLTIRTPTPLLSFSSPLPPSPSPPSLSGLAPPSSLSSAPSPPAANPMPDSHSHSYSHSKQQTLVCHWRNLCYCTHLYDHNWCYWTNFYGLSSTFAFQLLNACSS